MKNISFRNDVLPLKNELFRLALRITLDKAEAEDIVQETMIKVWNRRDDWQAIGSIEAFCLTVCRNMALDRTRAAARRQTVMTADGAEAENRADASVAANPEQVAVQRDRVNLIRRIIDSLPEKQRSVMQLRDFEGKSYREIATVMGISEEQVKVNIFRARQAIKQKFIETDSYGL